MDEPRQGEMAKYQALGILAFVSGLFLVFGVKALVESEYNAEVLLGIGIGLGITWLVTIALIAILAPKVEPNFTMYEHPAGPHLWEFGRNR